MTNLDSFWASGGRLPDVVAPALNALQQYGLTRSDDDISNRIRLALMHRSFLYENRNLLPGVTPTHLDALTTLGSTFMRRTLGIGAYQRFGDVSSGLLSREVNHMGTLVPMWTAKTQWFRTAALLGKGQATTGLPEKASASLFHQLLGVLCLSDEATAAEELVAELHEEQGNYRVADPKTTLQEILGGKSLRYEYTRVGPDHLATFNAVVTDGTGRRGTGSGNNKTTASQAAAWSFIETHCLDLLPSDPVPTSPQSPNPITSIAEHERVVLHLQELFSLSDTARGLLSQALIHQSWAYEHADAMREAHQRDNQVLAYLGSVITNFEYTRSAAVSILSDQSTSDHGINTQQNETYAEAFHCTNSVTGLLLGRGMAREFSTSTTTASDSFKAIVGAVLLATHFPVTLADIWPDAWKPIWDLIAPGQARPVSARERLEQLATLSQLSVEFRLEGKGPDHARLYCAVMDVDSAALGRLVTITSPFERTKDQAREYCAVRLIAIVEALAADAPHTPVDSPTSLVQLLVEHLATILAANPTCHQYWARKRLLGLHLAHSTTRLLAWAEAVDTLIDVELEPGLVHELAAAYATAIGSTMQTGQDDLGDLSPRAVGSMADAVRLAIALATAQVEAGQADNADAELT